METTKIVITGKPLVDLDSIPDMLGGVVDSGIDRSFAPAGRLSLPCRDPALMREVTSFVSAASFWGVGRDVMELDDIVLKSTQVPIVKDDKGVCRMQTSLKVDRFAYDDAGSITMVQFVTGEGKKVLWPEA